MEEFGLEVDVYARKPSAVGVKERIEAFMLGRDPESGVKDG